MHTGWIEAFRASESFNWEAIERGLFFSGNIPELPPGYYEQWVADNHQINGEDITHHTRNQPHTDTEWDFPDGHGEPSTFASNQADWPELIPLPDWRAVLSGRVNRRTDQLARQWWARRNPTPAIIATTTPVRMSSRARRSNTRVTEPTRSSPLESAARPDDNNIRPIGPI